ncbi:DNA-dependent ATPase protein rad54 [Ranunculus cassubicifolius]
MEDEEDQMSSSSSSYSSDTSEEYNIDIDKNSEDDEDQSILSASPAEEENRKSQNVDALLSGDLVVRRQPLIPRVLSVSDGAAVARKPFKPPCPNGYSENNEALGRRLWARKRFVPWGSSKPVTVSIPSILDTPNNVEKNVPEETAALPPGVEPLVLWQPDESGEDRNNSAPIVVDTLLVRFLRPHQREGVQFMFDCVSGLLSSSGISGCILADDMGLGKTLQSITLLYTLLRQGFDGEPMVKKAIIVTPTSLVNNWESEIKKWVGDRVQLVALCESTRSDVVSGIDSFTRPRSPFKVLIVSYETFRMHTSKFEKSGSCDLLICDEAHRLKNDQTLTNRALASLSCKRRILLSGTPMQNDLEEFFAMVNFTNPGVLGDAAYFRRYYEAPIICGREPTASEEERKLGVDRSGELSGKVNQFILRRTNALLSNHLPPKIVEVVCCKLTPLQSELYNHFIHSKNVKKVIAAETKQAKILAYITALKKLCNHPKLIYDTVKTGSPGTSGFEDCIRFFPPEMFSGRSGSWTGGDGVWVELSGKMHVLARLLAHLRNKTDDRIVLVSNYTQTLDLFAQLCRERRYPFLRLDGTTSINKRQKLVNSFNDASKDEFVFLLSSKAGGCGLNLIGGNRLVLFDPDWNPANDKQAAARVWRDGQKKRVYIYRFLSTGTIEEKVYQRQMSKEGLQKVIQQEQVESNAPQGNTLSIEDLRDLFTFHENSRSEIHENMNCSRCSSSEPESSSPTGEVCEDDVGGFQAISGCLHKLKKSEKQVGTPLEEDLGSWGHHFCSTTVPDEIFQASAGDEVSFVFTNQVDGKLVPIESTRSKPREPERQQGQFSSIKERAKIQRTSLLSPRTPITPTFSSPVTPLTPSFSSSRPPLTPIFPSNHDPSTTTKNSPASCKPSQSRSLKLSQASPRTTSTPIPKKPRSSLGNQLPQKRLSASPVVENDDDFM